ncbi:MAG TPA: hypothetical protein VJN18_30070 [Polyangiaceae bacterium]|nr:hypothetical protein [Polyangiaceae bacterium]
MRSNAPVKAEALATRLLVALLVLPGVAWADLEDPFSEPRRPRPVEADVPPAPARTPRSQQGYQHWMGGLYFGRGLRLNNPYRLQTVLGDDAESLSLTASYLDLHAARTFSGPDGFEHGIAAHFSVAVQGIRQEVLTPSYLLARRFGPRMLGYARAGFPIVLEPDAAVGLEAGLGGAYFLSASLGIGAELDFSFFYGAATIEEAATVIPVMSLAFGMFFDWEFLP